MKIKENLTLYPFLLYAFFSVISITIAEIFFIIGIILCIYEIITQKINIKKVFYSPVTLPLFVFILLHFISAISGIDPLNSLKDARKIYLIFMFFLSAYFLNNREKIKAALDAFSSGAGFIGLYAILTSIYFKYIKGNVDFRASSFSGNHMHLGGMLMMALIIIFILLLFYIKEKEKTKIYFYLINFILVFFGLLFTYTRGSWIACFCGILLMLFFINKKWFSGAILISVILFMLFMNTSFAQRIIRTVTYFSGDSATERIYMWQSGLKIIRDYPLFGIGTANLEKIYPFYIHKKAREKNQGHLHNNILQIAVIDGLLGLSAFFWIFITFFVHFFKNFKIAKNLFLKYISLAIFSISVAFFINGFFEYNFFSSQVVLIFWFLTGIGEAAGRQVAYDKENR